jgi:hypothetical protein
MKNKISKLAVAALFSLTAVSALAQTVTINGVNYQLSVETTSFNGNEARFQANPWWGNQQLASQLATTYYGAHDATREFLAFQNDTTSVTSMIYAHNFNGYNHSVISYVIDRIAITDGYVFATSVNPVPEADTSAMLLMGAGVMGFMARRRKQTAA